MKVKAAEFSYRRMVGECKELDSPTSSNPACTIRSDLHGLSDIALPLNQGNYFSTLAEMRAKAVDCSLEQFDHLEKNPEESKILEEYFLTTIRSIGKEKKLMAALAPAIGQDANAREEYKLARLRAEAYLKSLPYSQFPSIRLMLNGLTEETSKADFAGAEELRPEARDMLLKSIRTSLKRAKKEAVDNVKVLRAFPPPQGDQYSDEVKQSLAQDTDLVTAFKIRSEIPEAQLEALACKVDAQFGRGAKYRDNAILVTSVLGPALVPMLMKAGALALASSATGAAAVGSFSVQTAGVLRAVSGFTLSLTLIDEVQKQCVPEATLKGVKPASNQCEVNVVKSLENDKCGLALVIGTLAAKQASGLKLPSRRAKPAPVFDKDDKLVDHEAIVKSFNSRPKRSGSTSSKISSANANLPSAMVKKIESMKSHIINTPFDQAIYKRQNLSTNAKYREKPHEFLPPSKEMTDGLLSSYDDLHDKQKFANYIEDLVAETARKMMESSSETIRNLAKSGNIDQETLIGILKARIEARGLKTVTIPKDADVLGYDEFRKYIGQGPVIDEALGPGSNLADIHGVYPHILQMDYVLPSIEKHVGRQNLPKVFSYFGTERGLKFWNEAYDLTGDQAKMLGNTVFLKQVIMGKSHLNLP